VRRGGVDIDERGGGLGTVRKLLFEADLRGSLSAEEVERGGQREQEE
jgi:hypothetical protein